MTDGRLAGKTAVVTGGGSGLGAAVSAAFVREGARVVVADLDEARAQLVADQISADGEATAAGVDVGDAASVQRLFDEARDRLGPIDIVHTAAGNVAPAMLHKMTEDDFDAVVRTHLKGTYLCLRAVVSDWVERGAGKLVAVVSPAATEGQIGGCNYAAAKAGIIGLVKTAALELARHNVQVNAVLPIAATPMTEKVRSDAKLNEKFLGNIPMRRWAKPEEITPGVVYLASSEADYVTGIVLPIDGGRTI
jgi:3-oxoacyl-[acyl-carrier protein] reductase